MVHLLQRAYVRQMNRLVDKDTNRSWQGLFKQLLNHPARAIGELAAVRERDAKALDAERLHTVPGGRDTRLRNRNVRRIAVQIAARPARHQLEITRDSPWPPGRRTAVLDL